MTVRVRIAPSPTGSPHVGTAYIALFNYCFAKSQGGSFIVRIEDTDQERSDPKYEQMIMDALRWTGLSWDEGPDIGGPHGPYRQSERTSIYRQHAETLLAKGHAYHCFCTPDTLQAIRAVRFSQGLSTGYDGRCARLTAEEVLRRLREGEDHIIRMLVPEQGACVIHDPLRGEVTFDYSVIDHQVLLKSDGFPTYHLANVVDDHLMGITHVIRGEEWLPSLPKHLLLYQYFEWDAPVVYHLPLLRNEDKSKLSKRKNPTSILYYRDLGIIPEALLNFLGLMAYSMPGEREVFQLEEMVAGFDIKRMSLSGPVFDLQKLSWVNQQHLAQLTADELMKRLIDWKLNPEYMAQLMPMVAKRMHRLGDFMELCDFVFYSDVKVEAEDMVPKNRDQDGTRDMLQMFVWELEKVIDFHEEAIEQAFKTVAQIENWSLREITQAVRIAVTGKVVAPPLFGVMAVIGSDVCRNRLMHAIQLLAPLGKKKLAKLQEHYEKNRIS
ncbi:MAG: glutamate--tRNA ligase [Acidobacteria bacterium]|nr:glutamate--tRNA ligase [Acidobacteriota bacterium]